MKFEVQKSLFVFSLLMLASLSGCDSTNTPDSNTIKNVEWSDSFAMKGSKFKIASTVCNGTSDQPSDPENRLVAIFGETLISYRVSDSSQWPGHDEARDYDSIYRVNSLVGDASWKAVTSRGFDEELNEETIDFEGSNFEASYVINRMQKNTNAAGTFAAGTLYRWAIPDVRVRMMNIYVWDRRFQPIGFKGCYLYLYDRQPIEGDYFDVYPDMQELAADQGFE